MVREITVTAENVHNYSKYMFLARKSDNSKGHYNFFDSIHNFVPVFS